MAENRPASAIIAPRLEAPIAEGSPHESQEAEFRWDRGELNVQAEPEASKRSVLGIVHYEETPFVQQYSFPMGALWRGRVKLEGISSNYSMENLKWGLPAAGALPSWGVSLQSHVAVSAPNQAGAFGLSISVHRAGVRGDDPFYPVEWISRLLHNSRG